MLETESQLLVETLAEALETTAFVALMPGEPGAPAPAELRIVSIEFTRSDKAALELAAPRAFGQMLSANILGVEPDDEAAITGADDVLKEVVNITCGNLLMRLAQDTDESPKMSLPKINIPTDEQAWASFAHSPGAFVLDADGHTIAIRVKQSLKDEG